MYIRGKQGFEVRLYARNLKKVEDLFGPDGATVDVCLGDVKDARTLAEAAVGCQAAVWCAGSSSVLPLMNTYKDVSVVGDHVCGALFTDCWLQAQ